ncbi:unnamed protein product [Brassicogethes aeneus]|uniref:Osiris 10 n=1 Tax=Brassicogethes aeneus TaxID=1431903 RepID=A0A9P0B276_BRAAE|nr:unnamed protein product [Brassicogethes aeneus]
MSIPTSLCVCLFLLVSVQCSLSPADSAGLGGTFRDCLVSQPQSLGQCMAVGAISRLQDLDANPEFDLVDGVTLVKDNTQEYREDYNFAGTDTSSFRSIMDTFNHVFSNRNTQFSMDFLYPGLGMQLAPSSTPGGVLEFVLDPQREAANAYSLKEAGTGTLLARQFVLPFILGLKFKVATILPILFGILALLAKKAIVISKLALVVSSAFGLGTLLFGGAGASAASHSGSGVSLGYQGQNHHHSQHFNPGFGGHKYHDEDINIQNIAYRGAVNTKDQFRYSDDVSEREEKSKGRNFAWSEDDKVKKVTAN